MVGFGDGIEGAADAKGVGKGTSGKGNHISQWRSARRPRPAAAEVRILASPGGEVGPFLQLFERVNASGERVVIDGPCLSACTLVLSIVPDERICVTRRAVLGFHAARSIDRRGRIYAEPEASQAVLEAYPAAGARLDQPPRRIDVAAIAAARPRTGGDLSELQVSRRFGTAPRGRKVAFAFERTIRVRWTLRKLTSSNLRKRRFAQPSP